MSKLVKVGGICSVSAIIALMMLNFADNFRTSQQGLELIGQVEGCRRNPYHCPSDVLTVGIGSTVASSGAIEPHKRYSDAEIAKRWVNDIQAAERCVNQFANGRLMPQSVFDSVVSITFNVGCGKLSRSTMFRQANEKDWRGVCNEFPKWVYAGGKRLRGLEIRREKEKALCLSGVKQL
ncbi:lysozyme [Histophilus somni]|uniref:Lysozyme n=1 Tax=Histophilus somni TaxID=731 RepID=A0A9Q6Z1K0_HISSO|nr:lysozyme [Histophilus somni]QQF76760.1 lysozyme [Histophilus somni]QQF82727.1 lysozyme [Histophilus somni]QQF90668.1 lysozyme [Histophilus somni]